MGAGAAVAQAAICTKVWKLHAGWQASCFIPAMNNRSTIRIMHNPASSGNDEESLVDNEAHLEQQMAALDLSPETRRFLRDVHRAEKVLNNAYGKAQQDSPLDQRISQIYRDLYGSDKVLTEDDRSNNAAASLQRSYDVS